MGRAEPIPDLVLCQLAEAAGKVPVPPWSMACAEYAAQNEQSDDAE